jgi:transmembrane 9 superfamily member 2/4
LILILDGFPIGCGQDNPTFYLNNHLSFHIKYYQDKETKKYFIVGVGVIPASIEHTSTSCSNGKEVPSNLPKFSLKSGIKSVPWTYSVDWEETEIKWGSRWDAYLHINDPKEYTVHWFSILNSFGIVLFLTGIAAMISFPFF